MTEKQEAKALVTLSEQQLNDIVEDKVANLFSQLNKNILSSIKMEIEQTEIREFHSGPLPSPETLKEYSVLIPNAPERFISMVEKQGGHRRDKESELVDSQIKLAFRGQWFAVFIFVFGLSISTYLALQDKDIIAGIIASTTIVGVAYPLLTGKKKPKEEKAEKTE